MMNQLKEPYTDSFVISADERTIINAKMQELTSVHGPVSKSFALRTIIREWQQMKQEKK